MKMQEHRQKKKDLAIEARRLLDESSGRKWTDADQTHYDNLLNQIEDHQKAIDREQKLLDQMADREFDDLVTPKSSNKKPETTTGAVFRAFLSGSMQNLTPEQLAAYRNTMSTTTTTEGGFTVAQSVAARLVEALRGYSAMRSVAEVVRTERGNPLSVPGSNGVAEKGERVSENTTATSQDPTFTSRNMAATKYSSKIIAVPMELIMDSEIDIEDFVFRRIAARIGRIQNEDFTVGTGVNQPFGVVTESGAGKIGATGQTTTVTFDDLVDLQESVDDEYAKIGVGWMMSQAVRRTLRKLKDTAGRPIWTPGYDLGATANVADLLLGQPVTINNDMPAPAASQKSIVYGALGSYMIRDVLDVQFFRFTDSKYAEKGQVGFLAFARAGGNLLDVTAVKHYQHSAT